MAAYKIISAVIPERVDDSSSDRYLVVAPEDRIVWVTTDTPQDLSPEGRKQAVHEAGLMSLLNRLKKEENAVESESCSHVAVGGDAPMSAVEIYLEDEYDYDEVMAVLEELWEKEEKH